MKKLSIIFFTLLISIGVFAQPSRMSFQAVIRNTNGQLVSNSTVGIRLQILKGSEFGSAVFVENHFISTNANGLASFEIGGGSNVFGSIATIDWASGPYFLKTETDPNGGTNYSIIGTSQMLSVPYALFAGSGVKGDKGDQGEPGQQGIKGDKGDQGLPGIKGDKGDQGEPGQQGIKGDKGDQGLQGIEGDKGDQGVPGQQGIKGDKGDKGDDGNPGSANIYGNTGYLIKFNGSTSGDNSIIRQENNIININNPAGTGGKLNVRGANGGYGIHAESDFIGIQGEGSFGLYGIGINGGVGVKGNSSTNDGVQGEATTSGDGVQGTSYSGNGVRGTSTSSYGVQGTSTSGDGVRGTSYSADGVQGSSTSGNGVVGISISGPGLRGSSSSSFGVQGYSSTGIAGRFESGTNTGLFVASSSGAGVVINVAASGTAIQALQGNVYLAAGTGNVGIGTVNPTAKLSVNGTANKPGGGSWGVYSDRNLKRDIKPYKIGLAEILRVNPVYYKYNDKLDYDQNIEYVGIIAQELQKIAPGMVTEEVVTNKSDNSNDKYLKVDPSAFTYMLINAIKEQQQMIESLSQQIEAKIKMFESFQTKLDELYKEKLASDGH
ncbi:MAG: tail fiber domain-containing protein [Saprospiraceae bacterium]|nr:tail fiber domain-containing protein [Saprospiraceae bacterium]